MSKTLWPPERTARLLRLVDWGMTRREIAANMPGTCVYSISTKLYHLGIKDVPLDRESDAIPKIADNAKILMRLAHFPPFENVTKEEARIIVAGAPQSGRWRVKTMHPFSNIGNASGMCCP